MTEQTKILRISGEGGGLTVYSKPVEGAWAFKIVTGDYTPTLIDEEPIHGESRWAPTLADCLAYIGYDWNCLSPTFVHPDFADEIYGLKCAMDVERGDNPYVAGRWKEKCGLKPPK